MSKSHVFLLLMALYFRAFMSAQTVSVQAWDSIAVSRLDSLSEKSDEAEYFTGICVYDLTADSLLFGRNQNKLMRPASIQKLVTAIAALDQLGAEYPFETSARISGMLMTDSTSGNTLYGQIAVRGSMDPLSSQNDLQCIIDTLRRLGVKRIDGSVVADRSMKRDTTTLGPGWCWDDKNPVMDPMLNISVEKLMQSIINAGIEVNPRDNAPKLPVISDFVCSSHSVGQVLQRMMKNSDNQYAESMLCLLGSKAGGSNTGNDRTAQVNKTLTKTDQPLTAINVADGCGLSLYNYVTPRMMVALLRYAYQNGPVFEALLPSLPVAGKDGTLASRMHSTTGFSNVRAKTGTVSHVSSLAGYLTAPTGHLLAFAIISNGSARASSPKQLQDSICIALTQ